jgi:chromosome segregation ATPase
MEHESEMSGTDEDIEETTTNEVVPPPQERLKLDLSEDEYHNFKECIIYIHECDKELVEADQKIQSWGADIEELQNQIFLLNQKIEVQENKKRSIQDCRQQVQDEMDQFYNNWR